jgi:hypothetical protein
VRCSPWHDDRLPGKQSGGPARIQGIDTAAMPATPVGWSLAIGVGAGSGSVCRDGRSCCSERQRGRREELRLLNHLDGILAAIRLGLYNRRLEGLNSKIRLISQPSHRFHSAAPLIALIYLCCTCTVIDLGR